jgi:hypothetical protein
MLQGHACRIKSFQGDGAYGKFGFREWRRAGYSASRERRIRQSKKGENPRPAQHNEAVMFRYKTVFGGEMKARTAANQTAEVKLKCLLLNTFRETGMPDSYKVA